MLFRSVCICKFSLSDVACLIHDRHDMIFKWIFFNVATAKHLCYILYNSLFAFKLSFSWELPLVWCAAFVMCILGTWYMTGIGRIVHVTMWNTEIH